MTPSSSSKDNFYEKVINTYLPKVIKHLQAIDMREEVLHIRYVQGQKKEGSEKTRLAEVEHKIFKCQGMVESGLNSDHSMMTDFIHENRMDNKDIVDMIFKFHDKPKSLIYKTKTLSMNLVSRG
ncbi:40s ribosomal protein s5-1 [Hordeum vulgare]|nr:40s ribosomal protein s5-1 [Hordeum vulgare]